MIFGDVKMGVICARCGDIYSIIAISLIIIVIFDVIDHAVDVLKTKYMSDTVGRYASPLQCAVGAVQEGGFKIFMKVCFESHRSGLNDECAIYSAFIT